MKFLGFSSCRFVSLISIFVGYCDENISLSVLVMDVRSIILYLITFFSDLKQEVKQFLFFFFFFIIFRGCHSSS